MSNDWKKAVHYLGGSEADEARIIQELAQLVARQVGELHPGAGPKLRPQHAKALASTTGARFEVSEALAPDLRVGFLVPGAVYPATVRLSNAGALVVPDAQNDLRGLAFRVHLPDGRSQDFLATNAERHHAKTAFEAMWASYLLAQPGSKLPALVALAGKVGVGAAFRIVTTLAKQIRRPVASLATEAFWSRSAYRFGTTAVRFVVRPAAASEPVKVTPDLGAELVQRNWAGDVVYRLEVQRYVNEAKTPLEDSTKAWAAPFEEVATLVLPQNSALQDLGATEGLSFNPWNVAGPEFEPLGNLNRARKAVYQASFRARS